MVKSDVKTAGDAIKGALSFQTCFTATVTLGTVAPTASELSQAAALAESELRYLG
jgi:hypothetical protein